MRSLANLRPLLPGLAVTLLAGLVAGQQAPAGGAQAAPSSTGQQADAPAGAPAAAGDGDGPLDPESGPPANQPAQDGPAPSRWYLERGTQRRQALPEDDIPGQIDTLARLMRDDRVPGFYDGQFAATQDAFDDLARLARDPSIEHTLRMMAIMALQEAGDGPALAAVLEPLLMPAAQEFQIELDDYWDLGRTVDEEAVRDLLEADLSRHARFALAKDGQPAAVLEKIEEMRLYVLKDRELILDPSVRSERVPAIGLKRDVWFDIAYHYQQFDDFVHASQWFREMAESLGGAESTWCHYNLGCIAAIQGHADEAMQHLAAAAAAGFSDVGWLQEDGDLSSLRDRPDWAELVRSMGGVPENPNTADAAADPVTQP